MSEREWCFEKESVGLCSFYSIDEVGKSRKGGIACKGMRKLPFSSIKTFEYPKGSGPKRENDQLLRDHHYEFRYRNR